MNGRDEIHVTKWSDPRVYGTLLCFLISFSLFMYIETYVASEPVLPTQMLKLRSSCAIGWASFLGRYEDTLFTPCPYLDVETLNILLTLTLNEYPL